MSKQPSQKVLVLRHLVRYGSITDKVARDKYGITRLAARVWDLQQARNKAICIFRYSPHASESVEWFGILSYEIPFKTRLGRKGRFSKYAIPTFQRDRARRFLKKLEAK